MSIFSSTPAPKRTAKPLFALIAGGLLAGAAVAGAPSEAIATENCKNVTIEFKNATTHDVIKITDFQYSDKDASDGWRSETVDNKKINKGEQRSYNKDLEKVNHEKTKIRFTWKYQSGGSSWSSAHTELSKEFTCTSGTTVKIQVNGTNGD